MAFSAWVSKFEQYKCNCRIVDEFRSDGTSEVHLVCLLKEGPTSTLDQVVQVPIQGSSENLQGWISHVIFCQLVPIPNCSPSDGYFSHIIHSWNYLCCNLFALCHVLLLCTSEKSLVPSSLQDPSGSRRRNQFPPPSSLFSKLENPTSFSLSLYLLCSRLS